MLKIFGNMFADFFLILTGNDNFALTNDFLRFRVESSLRLLVSYRRIFADVIVYIFPLAYDLIQRNRGCIYELNSKVERVD